MLRFRAWPGAGRLETRRTEVSSFSGCCRHVCSEMLCAERWSALRGDVVPEELWRVPYEAPPMELRERLAGLLVGAGMSRKLALRGVSTPERLPGRALLMRLLGLLYDVVDEGRSLASEDGGRSPGTVDAGRGTPYERRLTWLSRRPLSGTESSDPVFEVMDVLIADGRLLVRRSVTDDGTKAPPAVRGEFRGVFCDGGSFDLAEWTRSSIFCMRLRRLFIWLSDSERAITVGWKLVRGQFGFTDLVSEAAMLLPEASDVPLVCLEDTCLAPWNERPPLHRHRGIGLKLDVRWNI
jgi:hypothetical protein